jgi:microcephalin
VAFVDVRTESDNRSRAVEGVLRQLGATIASKLTREVTHCVFKDGKKQTLDLALKYGVFLVSSMWTIK